MINIGAVDIGGTKIAAGVIREDGTILKRLACPTETEKGFQHAIERIVAMLRDLAADGSEFAGIGVGAGIAAYGLLPARDCDVVTCGNPPIRQ